MYLDDILLKSPNRSIYGYKLNIVHPQQDRFYPKLLSTSCPCLLFQYIVNEVVVSFVVNSVKITLVLFIYFCIFIYSKFNYKPPLIRS